MTVCTKTMLCVNLLVYSKTQGSVLLLIVFAKENLENVIL